MRSLRSHRFGAGLALDPGIDLSGEGLVEPYLVSWSCTCYDNGGSNADASFEASVTGGAPCKVAFKLIETATYYKTGWSTTEQNQPHDVNVVISNAIHRGVWYDLYWEWTVAGWKTGASVLVGTGAVYVPESGYGDTYQSG